MPNELVLDNRKWQFFCPYQTDIPQGYTKDTIWDYRLWEAREHFKHFRYQERFPPDKFPRMLMIGAGTGAEVKAAQEYGYSPIGIGLLNPDQVEYAHQQGVDFRVMDMHDLKFPNESVDIVFSKYSFEHCIHPWLAAMEAYCVLRPYGRWWNAMTVYKAGTDSDGPKHEHFMVLPEWFLAPLFRRTGFRILHWEDSEVRYECLLERLPLKDVVERGSIVGLLKKRLELGREYK